MMNLSKVQYVVQMYWKEHELFKKKFNLNLGGILKDGSNVHAI